MHRSTRPCPNYDQCGQLCFRPATAAPIQMMTQYVLVPVFAHNLRFGAVRHNISMRLRLQRLDEQSVKVGVSSRVALTTSRGLTYQIDYGTPCSGVRVRSVHVS